MSIGTAGASNGVGQEQWCQDGLDTVNEVRQRLGLPNILAVATIEQPSKVTITPFKKTMWVTDDDMRTSMDKLPWSDTPNWLSKESVKVFQDAVKAMAAMPINFNFPSMLGTFSNFGYPVSLPSYIHANDPATWLDVRPQNMPVKATTPSSGSIYGETFYYATVDGIKAYRCVSVMATTRDNRMGAVLQDVETGNETMTVACDDLDLPAHRRNGPVEWHWTEASAAGHVDNLQRQAKQGRAKGAVKAPTMMDLFRKAITDAIGNYKGRFKVEYTRALTGMAERPRHHASPIAEPILWVGEAIDTFEALVTRGYRHARAREEALSAVGKDSGATIEVRRSLATYMDARGFKQAKGDVK